MEVAASADAISFFLHPTIIGIVDYYLTTAVLDASMNLALAARCPTLHNLFNIFGTGGVPVHAKPMLRAMLDLCATTTPFLYEENTLRLQNRPFDVRLLVEDAPMNATESTALVVPTPQVNCFAQFSKKKLVDKYCIIPEMPSTLSGVFWAQTWPKLRQHCKYPQMDTTKPLEWRLKHYPSLAQE